MMCPEDIIRLHVLMNSFASFVQLSICLSINQSIDLSIESIYLL